MSEISHGLSFAYVLFCVIGFIVGEFVLMVNEQRKTGEISDKWYRVVPPSWAIGWLAFCMLFGLILIFIDIMLLK